MEELARSIREHVLHSNAIERIFAEDGESLFERHLEAAAYVAIQSQPGRHGWNIHPGEIHYRLLRDIEPFAGKQRTTELVVVDGKSGAENPMPPAHDVPRLMHDWEESFRAHWKAIYNHGVYHRHPWVVRQAEMYHDWLLCIHPYDDGNGRTARLVFNALLLAGRVPWKVIRVSEVDCYYARIQAYETQVFRPRYGYT